jgi:hypothetical protein
MGMETIKTPYNLKLKDGSTIPKGSTLLFVSTHPEKPSIGVFSWNGKEYRMRFRNVIKAPSMKRLERWVYDSVCESVFGNTCEADGFDALGSPSWLLALGMI